MSYAGKDIDLLQQFKQLIDVPEDKAEIKKGIQFIYRFSKLMQEKKLLLKIFNQLDYCNLSEEFSKANIFYNFVNYSIYGTFCFFSLLKPKKYTYKFLCFAAITSAQITLIEPFFLKLSFRHFGLTKNNYVGQELRLLYLFYLPRDPYVAEMKKKCEEYVEFMKNKKIRIEKYGEA